MNKLSLPCNCVGSKYCTKLIFYPYKGDDGDFEVFIGKDEKKAKDEHWIYLNRESIKKLRDYLKTI